MASVLWPWAGAGRPSHPPIVPLTWALGTVGRVVARTVMVRFVPFAPTHVVGVYPVAEAVSVCLPCSDAQLIELNTARPVESVVAVQGAGSADAPTRTAAPATGARVSSSVT